MLLLIVDLFIMVMGYIYHREHHVLVYRVFDNEIKVQGSLYLGTNHVIVYICK